MRRKKWLALIMAGIMSTVMLMGCAGKAEEAEKEGQQPDQKTEQNAAQEAEPGTQDQTPAPDGEWEYKEATLTMLIATDAPMAGLQEVCNLAKEKLGITVEMETRPGGAEGDNIVKTRLASGDMADICVYNSGSLLFALNPSEYFIDISGEEWQERLDDTYRNSVQVGDAVYGVPMSSTQAGCVLYYKPLYEKLGLEIPHTWDDFIANCDTIKEAGYTALLGTFADSWTSQILFLGDNYNVLAKEPDFAKEFEAGTAKYATTPAALESWNKLAQTTPYYNEDYLAATHEDGFEQMISGNVAHWVILTQALSNIYELYGDEVNNIGAFGVPGDDPDDHGLTAWMPINNLYGNKNTGKEEDIKRFMEFYISDEALDAYTSKALPDGPYCIKGYEVPDTAYAAVKDMETYFESGKTQVALEFLTAVKGANCPALCQECGSGQTTGEEAAKAYDQDCYKQAVQLGLDWEN